MKSFGKALGISREGAYDIFTREYLKREVIADICKALECQPSDFMDDDVKENVGTKNVTHETLLNDNLSNEIKLLRELLKAKEELIDILKSKPNPPTPVAPLEISDLLGKDNMKKVERFFGDLSGNSVCVANAAGRIEQVNEAFTQQTGYTLADVRARKIGEVLQRGDVDKQVKKKMHDAVLNRTYFEGEVLNYNKQGEPILCKLIIAPTKINGLEKLISIAVFSKVNVLKLN